MYEFMINDESRPMQERNAWMVLSHVSVIAERQMRIDSIERYVHDAQHHEVVFKSNGSLYRVTTERDYSNPTLQKQETKLPPRRQVKEAPRHSRTYERLSAQLFPTLA